MNEKNHIESAYEPSADESRSLGLFHEGQEAAINTDLENATAKLEQSLSMAKKEADKEWVAYIEGTLSYLRGDLAGLGSHISNAGANAEILSRLAKGLEHRGSVNYKEDYGA